eukprot:TRINITY_DN9626_c0_g1_i1.p1 TRINITY_DN9626_c0_g1~~TRINITY_DN9626_c0_g1_i1.p1  ORF type:complete len:537 (+),score=87.91 TRINITY_DN9626_c0_g1_i1:197-1612(+)
MLNDLYILHPETMSWSRPITTGQAPRPRAGHTTTMVGNKLFILGGGDGENYLNDLYILDTETMAWSQAYTAGTSPCARSRHTATLTGNRLFVIAGGGDTGRVYNDVYVLDTETMAWSRPNIKGPQLIARWGHSTTLLSNNRLLVFGGHDGTRMLNDVHILDTDTLTWSQPTIQVPSDIMPCPRAGHTATFVTYGNVKKLLLFGGGDGNKIYNDLYLIDLDTFQCEAPVIKGPLPAARCAHTTNLVDGKLIVFGGGDGSRRFKDVYVLDTVEMFKTEEPKRANNSKLQRVPKNLEKRSAVFTDVQLWLKSIGMSKYADKFIKEEIDMAVLPYLTDDHLKSLKIPTLGARLRIMQAIKTLREETEEEEFTQSSTQLKQLERSVEKLISAVVQASNVLSEAMKVCSQTFSANLNQTQDSLDQLSGSSKSVEYNKVEPSNVVSKEEQINLNTETISREPQPAYRKESEGATKLPS